MTPPKSHSTARGVFAWLVFMVVRRCLPCSCPSRPLFHALHRRRVGHWPPSAVTPDRNTQMSEAAVLPRGSAVAQSSEVQMVETGRSDGRNRRAAETRRKIIAAAKEMIAETSTAPTVVAVAKRADVSVRSVFQHFGDVESLFVTVVDSVRGDLVVPPLNSETLPLAARIDSFTRNMAQLYDQIVPLRVAAGQFVNHQGLIERGMVMQKGLRDATFRVFE